jgi:hypothetical protein
MNEPRKHHYVPVFYLKQWAGTDGRVCEYSKPWQNSVVPKRCHPQATGYRVDLYHVEGVPSDEAHAIERVFMRMVDGQAKEALDQILTGNASLSEPLRLAWTRFMLSLIFRNPEAVAMIKEQWQAIWTSAVAEFWRKSTDPTTFEEYMALIEPTAPFKAAFVFLEEMIDNPRFKKTIFDMTWHRVGLGQSSLPLLTSDRPLERPLGWDSPEAYVALPIAPKVLFLAAHDDRWVARIRESDHTKAVIQLNRATIRRARKYVWAIDDNYLNRVQELMSLDPDQVLISDEQKQRALDAAAGRASPQGD